MARHKVLRSPRSLRRLRLAARLRRAAGLFLAAAALAGAFYLLSRPVFSITGVTVVGDTPVPERELVSTVENELSGQYLFSLPKSHMLLYPRRAIEAALLRRFPILQSADVSLRNLASLQVAVAPRRGAALWCVTAREGSLLCALLDRTGFAFEATAPASYPLFPRITDEEATSSPRIGGQAISEPRLLSLLSLHERLEALGIATQELRLRGNEVAASLSGGSEVFFRDESDFAPALARLETLLSEKDLVPRNGGDGLRVEYIDLRYGNKIYFKPR